jgi:hypothetical protein
MDLNVQQNHRYLIESNAAYKMVEDDLCLREIDLCSLQEELADTKGAIRIRISKKNRQQDVEKKKYKWTNNDLQNLHIKLKIE